MTIAVDMGRKATKTNKQTKMTIFANLDGFDKHASSILTRAITIQWFMNSCLVTDTIYIFTVAKQGFLGNFGTRILYQKVLSE